MNQQYDFTIQRQLNNKMSVELGYIGRHITHEFQPVNITAIPYMMTLGGQRFDKAYGQMVMQYCGGNAGLAGGNCAGNLSAVTMQPFFETALAGTGYCDGVGGSTNCTQALAFREGNVSTGGSGNIPSASVWSLWNDLDGGNTACTSGRSALGGPCGFNFARSTQASPLNCVLGSEMGCGGQLTSGVGENTSLGYGNYNALFVSYKMSTWHGLAMQSNFTWSKALGTGSLVQATSQYTANDPFDLGRGYGYQPWDRKFMFNVWFTYTPPVYQGQHGVAGHLLGGWTIAPILDVGSGIPFGVGPVGFGSSVYTGGQEFGATDGGNIGSYSNAVNICGNQGISSSRHNTFDASVAGTAGTPNLFANPGTVYNCFRNPILGIDNGHNGGVGNYRGMPFWNVDFSIKKNLAITERFGAEFGAVFTNVFNHVQLYDPGLPFLGDTGDFGSLVGAAGGFQVNNGRKIEVDFRLKF